MSGYLSDKLQKLQNRAARVITKLPFDTSSNLLLAKLKWEKLSVRRKKQKALIMYKTLNELAPEYLQCLFTQRYFNGYNLRNLEGKLSLPKPNTNYLKRSFCYSGACLWNNLPQDLKSVGSIGQFKRGIRRYLRYRIPTRQSCKTVLMSFSLHYITLHDQIFSSYFMFLKSQQEGSL